MNKCKTCKWFKSGANIQGVFIRNGICYYNPPEVNPQNAKEEGLRPVVREEDYCKFHEPK